MRGYVQKSGSVIPARHSEVGRHDAGAVRAFGLDAARRDSVDPDFSRPQLRREPTRNRIDGAFGRLKSPWQIEVPRARGAAWNYCGFDGIDRLETLVAI